jgi:myo-inositol catabolism protein IolC
MTLGYDRPLYILPFDHRHSYGADVFGFHEPMNSDEIRVVAHSKAVIYRGFQQAVRQGAPQDRSGILVDEEFGAEILREAVASGTITCMPTEKSGQHEFDFQYGDQFAQHIESFNPTFTKVLVRYNVEGDAAMNGRQTARLKTLSDYLRGHGRRFMFELLVPPEAAQLAALAGDKLAFDRQLRPGLMERAIRVLQDSGVEPDVWKIEGLDREADCTRIVAAARRDGRDRVGTIVLGRGEDEAHVVTWLQTAARVTGFIGFAVGRSTFLEPIKQLQSGQWTEAQVADEVARRFLEWISVFTAAQGG